MGIHQHALSSPQLRHDYQPAQLAPGEADCVASYPAGLTAAQVAQRVQTSYYYDNNSFSSEADRDDYIRRQLRNEISDEYADRHDGAYPDEEYLNEETERRFAERTGMATPESAQA